MFGFLSTVRTSSCPGTPEDARRTKTQLTQATFCLASWRNTPLLVIGFSVSWRALKSQWRRSEGQGHYPENRLCNFLASINEFGRERLRYTVSLKSYREVEIFGGCRP